MFRHGSLDSAPSGFAQGKRDKFRRALTIREGAETSCNNNKGFNP